MFEWVLLASTLTLFILAMVSVFVIIPKSRRSQARDRLWQLRDELFDACIQDEIPGGHPSIIHLRKMIEFTLEHEKAFRLSTFVAFFAANRVSKGKLSRLISRDPAPTRDTLTPSQRELVEDFDRRFTSALVGLVLFGSTGAVLIMLWLAPLSALHRLRNRGPRGGDGAGTRIFGPELRPYTEQLAGSAGSFR